MFIYHISHYIQLVTGTENLIVSLKQKTAELKANEASNNTLKRTNPFKKLGDQKLEDNRGLNGLMKIQQSGLVKKNVSNTTLSKALPSVKV